jgi:hypothetical protein
MVFPVCKSTDNDEIGLKSGKIHREGPFGMSKSKIHKMANNAF